MKYRPEHPDRFNEPEEARDWARGFFHWYNHEHHHSGLGLMTPAAVHYGLADKVYKQRRQILVAAYGAHPERFVRGEPTPPRWPDEVWINPPQNCHKPADLVDPVTGEIGPSSLDVVAKDHSARDLDMSEDPAPMERLPDQPHFQEILLPKFERELSQDH